CSISFCSSYRHHCDLHSFPTRRSSDLALQCLKAGKHVVVDKPVTIFSHEAETLNKLAEEKGLICSVFHNRRYDGDFMTLQKLVRDRKSTRLNSSHVKISYAVFCLKKKK